MLEVTKVRVHKISAGKMIGFADIEFNNFMTWKGWRLFRDDQGGGISVAVPTSKNIDKEGNVKYDQLVYINKEDSMGQQLMEQITQRVSIEYETPTENAHKKQDGGAVNSTPADDDDVPF